MFTNCVTYNIINKCIIFFFFVISDTLIYGNTYIAKFIISLIYITVNKFMNYFFLFYD